MSYQAAPPTSAPRIKPCAASWRMPPLSVVSPDARDAVERVEERWGTDEEAGVERVVGAELLANRRDVDRRAGEPWWLRRRSRGDRPRVDREHRFVAGPHACRSKREQRRRLEQVVAHQQREAW